MAVLRMKASALLKHNIETLLRARDQKDSDLARYCRRSRSWISKLLSDKEERNIQMKYLDRIADFFGIATYQLLQPGISPLTERRVVSDRRSGRDRRISRAIPLSQKPGDVDLLDVIRALSREGRERAIVLLGDVLHDELQGPRSRATESDPQRHRRKNSEGAPRGKTNEP